MTKDEFIKYLKELGIIIRTDQLNKIDKYCKFLMKYNETTNITAIKEENEMYLNHFYDSLTIVKSIDLNKEQKLLDIGSGGGFPGVVLKIIYPNLKLTLIDSNNKKTTFLKKLCSELEINDIEIINDRAESFINNRREYYDVVTARAVSNLRVLTELSVPFLRVDGLFIALKGNVDTEIEESIHTINVLNSEIIDIKKFNLPISGSNRSLVSIKKNKITDIKYPRRYEQIIKKSL